MMITTHLRNLLTAVICIFAGATAQAQFTGSADQYPTTGYEGSPITFALSDVATTLGTDAATLGAAISEYVSAETPATILFAANGTEWAAELEAANHGFWMAADGTPVGHGDASVWYCSPDVDDEFTTLTFNVGQMPRVMAAGDKGQTTITLKFNEKEATFALTLNVIAKPEYNIPEPTVIEKDLNIVGTAEVTVEQYPRSGYESDPIEVDLGDLPAKLGIDQIGVLTDELGQIVYTTWYNNGDIELGGGLKKDSLTNKPTGEGVGYWFRPVQNEAGEEYGEVSATNWGGDDKFYINYLTYDIETGKLSGVLGQYPGSCNANEKWYAVLYLIWGNKAYQLRVNLNLIERETEGLEGMTKVGEAEFVIEQYPATSYATSPFHPDVDAIAEALGTEVGYFSYNALDDENSIAPGYTTGTTEYGYWFNREGYVTTWGDNAFFYINPASQTDFSTMNIGQYPGHLSAGDKVETNLLFVKDDKYYNIHVVLNIISEEGKPDPNDFKSVATRSAVIQAIPLADAYTIEQTWTIALDQLESLIGTTDAALYGLTNPDKVAEGEAKYTDSYSCTPYPGFWLNNDGYADSWGSSPVGITYEVASGEFTFYQMPGLNNVGDVFKAPLYLVNVETGNMVTINFTVQFVAEIVEYEEVGSENVVIPVSMAEDCAIELDFAPAAEALGVSVDELTAESSRYLKGMMAGTYSEGVNIQTGLTFDANGECNSQGDYYFWFENGKLYSGTNVDIPEDFSLPVQFAFNIDDKLYVYYATFVSTEIYTGIKNVGTDVKADNRIFDISGRQVSKPTRGIYIQNGKKVVIK